MAVLAAALVWVVSGTLQSPITNAGDKAPDFTVISDEGHRITPEQFGGKLLVLNFWASWCAPCAQETPTLNAFYQEFAPKGVVVLAVSIDKNEALYDQFVKAFKVRYDTWRDPNADISARYGTFQFPESYIIDQSGTVVEKIPDAQNFMDPEFLARIQKLL